MEKLNNSRSDMLFHNQKNTEDLELKENKVTNIKEPIEPKYILKRINFLLVSKDRFSVECSYDVNVVNIFKIMPTKQYDVKTKIWNFDLSDYFHLVCQIKGLDKKFALSEIPNKVINYFLSLRTNRPLVFSLNDTIDDKIRDSLLPYQLESVKKAVENNGRILIADEMGLGKTIQSLAIACYYKPEWPLLIVCPASLKYSWKNAILEWIPSITENDINMLCSNNKINIKLTNIISYDSVSKIMDELKKSNFKIIIADESHNLKNYTSKKTKNFVAISKNCKRVVLLSGTPLLSKPCELFNQINIISPGLFDDYHKYGLRYCNAKLTKYGFDYSGSSNLSELKLILESKIMIRRLKVDVLTSLPGKNRKIVYLDVSKIDYTKIQHNAQIKGKKDNNSTLLAYFNDSAFAKCPALIHFFEQIIPKLSKFIIFAHHQIIIDSLALFFKEKKISHIKIDGSTNSGLRQELCDQFQHSTECKVAILSISSCNTGLDLTSCSTVIFAELFWNPGVLQQAEDRVHRIGQTKNVEIIYLIGKRTIDDEIWPLLNKKLNISSNTGLVLNDFSAIQTF